MNTTDTKFNVSISKDALAKLPAAEYKGAIHLIDTAEKIPQAVEILQKEKLIGFDTETKPTFKKGQSNNVSLIQLCTHTDCYLFRINRTGISHELSQLLENPNVTKVGLSMHDDFHNLAKISDFHPAGFIELQQYVKRYGIIDNSLTRIYAILFGHRIAKGQRLTNWEAPELTEHQQIYASLDAKACIDIYEYIHSNKFDPSKSQYIVPDEEVKDNSDKEK